MPLPNGRPAFLAAAIALGFAATVGHAAQAAVTSAPAARPAIWSTAIDSRNSDQWLTQRRGVVFTERSGRVVAIDTATGRDRWQSGSGVTGRPALSGRRIYAPDATGIRILDAANGRILAHRVTAGEPRLLPAAATALAVSPLSGSRGLLVNGFQGGDRPAWERRLHFATDARPIALGGDAVGLYSDWNKAIIVLDARTGKTVAATDGIEDLIGADGRYLWFNVSGGVLKGLDLVTARTVSTHDRIVRDAVRVEHSLAIAVIDGRLHRLNLAAGTDSALHIDGRWVGGPVDGKIFIARGSQLFIMPIDRSYAVRVARNTNDAKFLTSDGRSAYIGERDGTISVIDVAHETLTERWSTPCRWFIEGIMNAPGFSFVHCDVDADHSRLLAFRR